MSLAVRLEAYMRRVAAQTHEVIDLPPFVLYFDPHDPLRFFNYARPSEPVAGDLDAALSEVSVAFIARHRLPRFEFVETFAPGLAASLLRTGYQLEAAYPLLACTRDTLRPAPAVSTLAIETLTSESSIQTLLEYSNVQREGFGESTRAVGEADIVSLRHALEHGGGFLARLEALPVAAAQYTPPLDGLVELGGIATLAPYRRRGIATALTQCAASAAFEQGAEMVFLSASDERAGRVYRRVGFQPCDRVLAYCKF